METNDSNALPPGDNGNPFLNIPPILPPKSRDDGVLSKDFVCAVCYELPISAREALVTPCCQHVFCKKCITTAIRTTGVCPLDRKSLSTLFSNRANRPVLLEGLSKRVFESIPVVCPRDGCSWKGWLSGYCSHAEDCALSASVSDTSKLDLAKKLHNAERQLKFTRNRCRRLKENLDGVVDRLEENSNDYKKLIEEYEKFRKRHNYFKELVGSKMDKLEKKVSKLEKEKAEFVTIFTSPENDWSNRLRKRGRT